ncbi:hypothetical protein HY480_04230, partial [Candidatus Uhrbacteria bacterium]|nr:hypothetical protein [Candidatus Uhrbacteria bacterium]
MRKNTHMVRRSLTWAALGILIPLAGIAHPQTGPVIQSTRAMSMPTIDGTATANEWPVAAYPVEFRLPRGTVSGTLRTMWDANTVYLAVDVTHAPFANELDVILDEQANGVLDQGDPAYLAWASGAAQGFHYDARRRGFVQDRRDSGNDFLRASRIQGPTRTFEIAIPYDPYDGEDLNRAPAAWGSMGLALKLEAAGAAGQFDTWPTPGTRDPITRSPHLWSLLTFLPSTTPT